ncbi:MAG TPA: histidine kinase [Kineosporiaceae bacterium]|nr:histidine kinase [Kineosporiaceae bacterium]
MDTAIRRAAVEDVCVTAAAVFISVLVMRVPTPILEPLGGATITAQVALAGCLLWRRRAPLTVLWIATLAAASITLAETVSPGSLVPAGLGPTRLPWIPPAAPFAVYSAMVYGRDRRTAWVAALVLTVLGWHFWDAPADARWPVQSVLFIGGPALLGLYVAARQRLLGSLVDRAERAEREQYLLAERVLAEERSRVAAEMHDVVTHRVSLMVLQAGALRVSSANEEVRLAAEELRMTGCRALEELRDLIGLLHGTAVGVVDDLSPEALGAPTAVPNLAALVDESRSVGVRVELLEEGSPAVLAPIIARTAHRVVQEALTNVRKHAPGASAQVHVRYLPTGVRLSVRNTAPTRPVDSALSTAGSGSGLTGLRQRIELINGSLQAGPARDPAHVGGFHVEACLPADIAVAETAGSSRES